MTLLNKRLTLIICASSFALLSACSLDGLNKWSLRTMLSVSLPAACTDNDLRCANAIEKHLDSCMDTADWKSYKANSDSEAELKRFTKELYDCIVDADGKPVLNIEEDSGPSDVNMFKR